MPSRRYTDKERKIGLTGLNGQKILVSSRYINRKKFNLLYFSEEKKLSENLLKLSNDLILKIHIKLLQKNVLYISTILLQLFYSLSKIYKIFNFKFYFGFFNIPPSPPPPENFFFIKTTFMCCHPQSEYRCPPFNHPFLATSKLVVPYGTYCYFRNVRKTSLENNV